MAAAGCPKTQPACAAGLCWSSRLPDACSPGILWASCDADHGCNRAASPMKAAGRLSARVPGGAQRPRRRGPNPHLGVWASQPGPQLKQLQPGRVRGRGQNAEQAQGPVRARQQEALALPVSAGRLHAWRPCQLRQTLPVSAAAACLAEPVSLRCRSWLAGMQTPRQQSTLVGTICLGRGIP